MTWAFCCERRRETTEAEGVAHVARAIDHRQRRKTVAARISAWRPPLSTRETGPRLCAVRGLSRVHARTYVRGKDKLQHTRVQHFSHTRRKSVNAHHRVRAGRPHDKCIRDGRRASNKRGGRRLTGPRCCTRVCASATASHVSGKGSADGQPRN